MLPIPAAVKSREALKYVVSGLRNATNGEGVTAAEERVELPDMSDRK
ncbi:hypothetical protein OF385_01885 [Glutamicibacter sp. JL.03c]|nr:hypothetical protein [Glutamicibacter sp. JL.03c]UYQ77949.1 hypothetical protein OF385_01885 [Glutamicibacter sp. JL.03c]